MEVLKIILKSREIVGGRKLDFRKDLTPLWRTLLKLRLPFVARKTNSEKKVYGRLNKDSLVSYRKVKIHYGKKNQKRTLHKKNP